MLASEVSISFGTGVFCNASIVADGGVFSPRIARGGGREVGRRFGVSLLKSLLLGVGVSDLVGLLVGDGFPPSNVDVRVSRSGEPRGPAFSK